MSAPVLTPSAPSRAGTARRPASARLPWWGVALPVLAFVALLMVPITADDSAPLVDATPVSDAVERVQRALTGA